LSSTIGNLSIQDFRLRIARQKYNFFQYRKQLMEKISFRFDNLLIIRCQ